MNEEIEYAEMLEIPISTVNLVRKKHAKKKRQSQTEKQDIDLKQSVISQVNAQLLADANGCVSVEKQLLAESANSEGRLVFDGVPERIDTVRVYNQDDKEYIEKEFSDIPKEDFFMDESRENEGGRYALNPISRKERRVKTLLNVEFAAACALCGVIFLTNVFMPTSAINTFFRGLTGGVSASKTDTRTYSEFTLLPIISENADAELTLSQQGVLSIIGKCCVYPSADGNVKQVTREEDGTYTVNIAYSSSFTGVMTGLTEVFYQEGDNVKAQVPIGYADGESVVEVTMYTAGELLTCFFLTDENCLAWVDS